MGIPLLLHNCIKLVYVKASYEFMLKHTAEIIFYQSKYRKTYLERSMTLHSDPPTHLYAICYKSGRSLT